MPPARVVPAHVKPFNASASVMLLPAEPTVDAVTVTTEPEEVALTPTELPFRVIAAARLVASSANTLSMAKEVPVFEPLTPPEKVAAESVTPLVAVSVSV